MINICNLIIFCIYIFVKRTIKLYDLLQFVFIMINGLLVDLILDKLLSAWEIDVYIVKAGFFLIGLFIAAFSLGQILRMGLVRFPLESLCLELAEKTTFSFGHIRYAFDFIFIVGVVCVFILDHQIMTIREGTVVSFLLLSYLINISYKLTIRRNNTPI